MPFSLNDAYRIIRNVVDERISALTKSGAGIEYTWGTYAGADHEIITLIDEQFDDISDWSTFTGSGNGTVIEHEEGAAYQSNGYLWRYRTANLVYDPNKLYRLRVRFRWTESIDTTKSKFLAGLTGIISDGVTPVSVTGTNSYGAQHYFVANSRDLPILYAQGEWVEAIGYVKGLAATGIAGERPYPNNPAKMHTNTAFVRPTLILNYNAGPTGNIEQVDYFVVEELVENHSIGRVNLFGDAEASGGFWIENGLSPQVGDPVRVAIDKRGNRWIDAVINDSTSTFPKMEIDPRNGEIRLGNGTVAPAVVTTQPDLIHDHDADYSDILHNHSVLPADVTIPKASGVSRITFPATFNDPGVIEHEELTGNVSTMRFSVGDDADANDNFVFGYIAGGVFTEKFRIDTLGDVTVNRNLSISGMNNQVWTYEKLSVPILIFNGATTTTAIAWASCPEITGLPSGVVRAIHGRISITGSSLGTGPELKVTHYGETGGGFTHSVITQVAGRQNISAYGPILTGGTNNRQINYEVTINSGGTITYTASIIGYWRVKA